ncbi:MAG: PqiC family protein [Granulosicoccus sp.]
MQLLPAASRGITVAGLVAFILGVSACGNGPAPRLYLLEPWYESAPRVIQTELSELGLSIVSLPGYAKNERIATRDKTASVSLDDRHRWAESPEQAITRVLAEGLRIHSGATVLTEPWPRGYKPQARIEVVFDRLLREPNGGSDMAGQIRLIAGDGRSVLSVTPFQVTYDGNSPEPEAFFRSTAAAINDIARMAIAALRNGADAS